MAKATDKREHLSGAFLTVLESRSMMIMAGSVAANKQAWHWNKSRDLKSYPQAGSTEGKTGPGLVDFEISKPTSSHTPSNLPRRSHLLISPTQFQQLET